MACNSYYKWKWKYQNQFLFKDFTLNLHQISLLRNAVQMSLEPNKYAAVVSKVFPKYFIVIHAL